MMFARVLWNIFRRAVLVIWPNRGHEITGTSRVKCPESKKFQRIEPRTASFGCGCRSQLYQRDRTRQKFSINRCSGADRTCSRNRPTRVTKQEGLILPEITSVRTTAEAIGRISCIKTGEEIGLLYRWDNGETQAALHNDGEPIAQHNSELTTEPDIGGKRS